MRVQRPPRVSVEPFTASAPAAPLRDRLSRGLTRAYREAAGRTQRQPSFNYKVLEASRTRRRLRAYGHKDPAFLVDAKDDAHAWLEQLGVRRPALLGAVEHPGLIDWDGLPSRVVVKPSRGTATAGIYLLVRDEGGCREIVRGVAITPEEVVEELTGLFEQGIVDGPVLLEELVHDSRTEDGSPIDYKVHTFFGRVGLIEGKRRSAGVDGTVVSSFCIYDETWTQLGNVFLDARYDSGIPPPRDPGRLLELARHVSSAIPRPYLRVDLLEDDDGPLVGEVTPEPGGNTMLPRRLERQLGELWEDAEVRLRARAARAGWLDPVTRPLPEASLATGRHPDVRSR